MTKLRQFWQSINASYWFLPALFSAVAWMLAMTTIALDRTGNAEFLRDVPWIELARPQGASNMLTVIAGSMIGVASTVFSITIAAVAYASGNYGPRLLTNFMEDRGNQFSLAVFIATFVFAITVLGFVRSSEEATVFDPRETGDISAFVPQLSLLVAYALMGLSIATLVFFLNHIPASIRVNSVLKGIGVRLIGYIEQTFPDTDTKAVERQTPDGEPVCTRRTGYVQIIDYERLDRIARREGDTVKLAIRTGDFVHPDMALVYWPGGEAHLECADEVRACFALGGRRTPSQDLHFLLDELVEIGLRALSPGINDPFTAITALHWLGAATAELGRRDLTRKFGGAKDANSDRIVLLDDNYEHYLRRGLGSMRGGVATSPIAATVMFDVLASAANTLHDDRRRRAMAEEGERLRQQAQIELEGPNLEGVEEAWERFCGRMAGDRRVPTPSG